MSMVRIENTIGIDIKIRFITVTVKSHSHSCLRCKTRTFLTTEFFQNSPMPYLLIFNSDQNIPKVPLEKLPLFGENVIQLQRLHYLSYTKTSQTKCHKQSGTVFQVSF